MGAPPAISDPRTRLNGHGRISRPGIKNAVKARAPNAASSTDKMEALQERVNYLERLLLSRVANSTELPSLHLPSSSSSTLPRSLADSQSSATSGAPDIRATATKTSRPRSLTKLPKAKRAAPASTLTANVDFSGKSSSTVSNPSTCSTSVDLTTENVSLTLPSSAVCGSESVDAVNVNQETCIQRSLIREAERTNPLERASQVPADSTYWYYASPVSPGQLAPSEFCPATGGVRSRKRKVPGYT